MKGVVSVNMMGGLFKGSTAQVAEESEINLQRVNRRRRKDVQSKCWPLRVAVAPRVKR